jgi:hypothetical protein
MSNILGLLLGIVIVAFIIGMPIYTVQAHKKKIQTVLESRGATNIAIEYLMLTLDRSNYSYDVSYHDANGKFHMTKCKMSIMDDKIFWMDEDIRD